MRKVILLYLIIFNVYALEPFQEQTPLPMAAPNITKEQSARWIPLTPTFQETPVKNTHISNKTLNETIKTQIQKKMNALLKPLKDDEDEQ